MKNAVEFLECSQVNEINNGCRTRIGSFIKNELVKLQWPNLLILSIVYFSILPFFSILFLFLPPPRQVSNFRNSIDLITYQIAAKVDAMVGIFGIFNRVECDEINNGYRTRIGSFIKSTMTKFAYPFNNIFLANSKLNFTSKSSSILPFLIAPLLSNHRSRICSNRFDSKQL